MCFHCTLLILMVGTCISSREVNHVLQAGSLYSRQICAVLSRTFSKYPFVYKATSKTASLRSSKFSYHNMNPKKDFQLIMDPPSLQKHSPNPHSPMHQPCHIITSLPKVQWIHRVTNQNNKNSLFLISSMRTNDQRPTPQHIRSQPISPHHRHKSLSEQVQYLSCLYIWF